MKQENPGKKHRETSTGEARTSQIEGRRAVLEALRAKRTLNRLYILDGCHDAPVEAIRREAKKNGVDVQYVAKERLDQLSESGHHQGVLAFAAAHAYAMLADVFSLAEERDEKPLIFLLDNIEDPHNLGAIIRTANVCGAHGVVIPKNRSAQLTATVEKAAAGALSYTPVVRVTNLTQTMETLKERGLWLVCADMDGAPMTGLDLKGAVGLVIGNEGSGVSPLVKKHCDLTASIPVRGEISSLNASVAAGVLAYEILRQRMSS
ncbi:MAG: 23S rRNA (guanosine(2251)-2'-O)-methyltransferase RlmB [Lachnospiraceae bacterium]|nr:23S rRNA (guanosine(2251)-2'-O)-methyltransferase RlmB [Lachnospiraceae bacterium]